MTGRSGASLSTLNPSRSEAQPSPSMGRLRARRRTGRAQCAERASVSSAAAGTDFGLLAAAIAFAIAAARSNGFVGERATRRMRAHSANGETRASRRRGGHREIGHAECCARHMRDEWFPRPKWWASDMALSVPAQMASASCTASTAHHGVQPTWVDLIALRDQLAARKEELMAQESSRGLPPAKPTVVNLVVA